MPDLKLTFEGENAGQAAKKFAAAFEAKLGQRPKMETGEVRDDTTRDAGLLLAGAAVVLAIPGAILAARDLVQMFKAKDNAQVVIELSQEALAQHPGLRVSVSAPAGATVQISGLDPVALVDLASKGGEAK